MEILNRAGYDLALELHASVEAGFVSDSTIDASRAYGLEGILRDLRNHPSESIVDSLYRDGLVTSFAHGVGCIEGQAHVRLGEHRVDNEVGGLEALRSQYAEAVSSWIVKNRLAVMKISQDREAGLWDPKSMTSEERQENIENARLSARHFVTECYLDGFVGAACLAWFETFAPGVTERMSAEVLGALTSPHMGPEFMEGKIEALTCRLWTEGLRDLHWMLVAASLLVAKRETDAYAFREMTKRVYGRIDTGRDPLLIARDIRNEVFGNYSSLDSEAGLKRASCMRLIRQYLSSFELQRMVELKALSLAG